MLDLKNTEIKIKLQKKTFSLYNVLIKKIRKELVIWYALIFLYSFFYYQAVNGIKLWGRESTKFPLSNFFGLFRVNSRVGLLQFAFICFFICHLPLSLIGEYLKNFLLESCRNDLRKFLIKLSGKNPYQTKKYRKELLNIFLGEIELFIPLFILVPQRIFTAIINIFFTIFFLSSFSPNELTIPFIFTTSLIIIILTFFSYKIQAKINFKQNRFRQQENIVMENYLESQHNQKKIEKLVNSNFSKTRTILWKKSLSYLPTLAIPGLTILFCFIYSIGYGNNWEIKNFVDTFLVAASIQTVFWKVKEITDSLPEISKIKIHLESLNKMVKKLAKNK